MRLVLVAMGLLQAMGPLQDMEVTALLQVMVAMEVPLVVQSGKCCTTHNNGLITTTQPPDNLSGRSRQECHKQGVHPCLKAASCVFFGSASFVMCSSFVAWVHLASLDVLLECTAAL